MSTPRIGIIGAGNMGGIHARVVSNARALAAIADTDLSKAETLAKRYGVRAYDSFEDMLEKERIDAVIISTPTSTHAAIAEKIAEEYESIKGILIEKPLASTLEDAKRVAEILEERKVGAIVSHSEIYNPVVERALTLVKSGNIGTPRTIIHDRRGFVEPQRIPSLGDVFEDIGVHDFDIMARISGGPAKLYAQGNTQMGIYNSGTVLIRFDSGIQHVFHLSREYVGRRRLMDVSGTKGTLVLDLFSQIIKVQDLDQEPLADNRTIKLPERGATIKVYGEPVQEVINDFLRCIEKGSKPKVGLDDGVAALRIVEAARESTKTRLPIDINVVLRE